MEKGSSLSYKSRKHKQMIKENREVGQCLKHQNIF